MTFSRTRLVLIGLCAVLVAAGALVASQLPMLGANGLLHPARHRVTVARPQSCQEAVLAGEGVTLAGWKCRAAAAPRGTLVYLHGIADNRGSSVEAIRRVGALGLDVVAYDSRAHGDSDGDVCTYGFREKQDLRRVLDTIDAGPIVLFGASLGAAVALQLAAEDVRVRGVVAAETFSDLRTVATERAPFFLPAAAIARAFELAERLGQFPVDAVSPVSAAAKITAPVLLIHGEADVHTPPDHSRRVFERLRGPKRLVLVPGAGHNGSLRAETWVEIEDWVLDIVERRTRGSKP